MINSAVRATTPLSCDLLSKGKKDMRETLPEYSLYYCRLLAVCNTLRFYSALLMIQYYLFMFGALVENVSQNIFHA